MTSAVVVTGLGIVSPGCLGARDYWERACGTKSAGRCPAAGPSGEPERPYGATGPDHLGPDLTGLDHLGPDLIGPDSAWPAYSGPDHPPARPQDDRIARLALAAADWALADAGIRREDLPGVRPGAAAAAPPAASAATARGGTGPGGRPGFGSAARTATGPRGPRDAYGDTYYRSFAWFYAVASGQISIRDGMKGLDAVAHARRQIRQGSRLIVSGGVDAPVRPPGRGTAVVRPGGGALLVLEDAVDALTRGAKIYGEVAGYGATFDPAPGGGREPGLRRAVELALADAQSVPGEVDAVFAPGPDAAEAAAVTAVFGVHGVPVTAPRTMTGRRYPGAAAPHDLAAALLAMREGLIPPTADVLPSPGYDLNLVRSARTAELRTTVVLGRGHGGFNSAVVLRAVD